MRSELAPAASEPRVEASRPAAREPAPLPAGFYDRPAARVARDLVGCRLISVGAEGRAAGVIVETEAYTGPEDDACHAAASIGRTKRNDPLYGAPGCAYMHLNYGIHWCLNAVTGPAGHPAGVLLRALEPVEGEELMRARRGRKELTNGPARLTEALGIGPNLQRHRLDRPPLWIGGGPGVPESALKRTPRIGISKARDRKLRFVDDRSSWITR